MNARRTVIVELEGAEDRAIPNIDGSRSLALILSDSGLPLNTRCGRQGLCHGCEVTLREGTLLVDGNIVSAPATVRACRARFAGDAAICLPVRSRIEHNPQVTEAFAIAIPYAHQPLFAPVPGLRDTAFAVDVGTTTVAVLLADLVTGEVLARAGAFNEQIRFGDNVLTRIEAASHSQTLAEMQAAVVMETLQPLLLQVCETAGRSTARLAGGTVAGNTTMLHLFAGEDPASLGVVPFTPRFIKGRRVTAEEMQLTAPGLASETPLQLLPGIAGYVGADITAGICATGMAFDAKPALLVDIGTNGEIVLQKEGKWTACAAAAGPAFEGCGLKCGTRAREGAVCDLRLTLDPFCLDTTVIGGLPLERASGLCGSAYVDFLASARKARLVRGNGRFDLDAWEMVPASHRRVERGGRILGLDAASGAGALSISEGDIARLLQAKAAIGAGVEILLRSAGLAAADIGTLYLAGGFGMHLNVAHAIAIGLLPGFRPEQVRVVGNTALAGALLALLDRNTLEEMQALSSQVEVLELSLNHGFEDSFIDHLMLP